MNIPTRNDRSHAAISLAQSRSLTQYDPGQLLSNVAGAEHRELCATGHCTFVVNAATFPADRYRHTAKRLYVPPIRTCD